MLDFLKNIFIKKPQADYKLLMANGALIVDVRTKKEFSQGHIQNAINIPLNELTKNLDNFDKNKTIITCCASGIRSESAKKTLISNGCISVYNGKSWKNLDKIIR